MSDDHKSLGSQGRLTVVWRGWKIQAAVLSWPNSRPSPWQSRTRGWAATPGGLIFAGTYTDKGTSQGIYGFHWDADAGTMTPLGLAAATVNPSFLALSPDRRHLYAVNEVDDYHGEKSGSITSFVVDGPKLKPINVVSSTGGGPCNIAVDFTGKAVFVANYGGGSAASFRVLKGGGLSKAVSSFQYTGHGADPKRQAAPHTHCTTVSRDNRYVLVNDLGLDHVSVYHLDPLTARLTPNTPPSYEALPGSGPRSFTFHPTGQWAYSLNEIASTLDVLAWDGERGTLNRIQNISTLPKALPDRIRRPRSRSIPPAGLSMPLTAGIIAWRFSPSTIAGERSKQSSMWTVAARAPAISPSIPAISGCWWPTRTPPISSSSPAARAPDF